MTAKRKAISKKTRFEVFKRDGFKCQYCGAMAPDVLLVVDHIQPLSKDGDHDILNFITACDPCNSGKGARTLDDASAVKKQQAQLSALQERREQLEMMLQWRAGLKDIEGDQVKIVEEAWSAAIPGWHLNDSGRKSVRQMLKKHGLQRVLDAIDTAADRYVKVIDGSLDGDSVQLAWNKVGGICALQAMPEDERRLYYIRGILNKRLAYVSYDVIELMRSALTEGCALEAIEQEAKTCRNWSSFRDWLAGI